MCGIAGILKSDNAAVDRTELCRMISTLHYRGPDAQGFHIAGPLGFAHARLSIIDLQSGDQPMSTVDRRYWITFNGEIFNYIELREELISKGHSFATRSDTEVILNAYREYGEDCVRHFNGQWAFAIWDTVEQKLFLSRDRAGVRPLFYTQTGDSFLFASEIKALFTSPEVSRDFDPIGMDQIFTFWLALPPRTPFKSISQLPPGYSMTVQGDHIRLHQYWSPPYGQAVDSLNGNDQARAEELLHLLYDATRIRLRSDVPVGAYLSGGIDSTLTTALIRKIAHDRLRSFSITFAEAEFDEGPYQRQASAFIGTQHSSVSCSQNDIAKVFPHVIQHAEQPLFRTAPAPMFLLSKLVRENGFKVVLTGEGADEALGGYDIFKEAKIRRFWGNNLDSKWRPLLLKRLYPFLPDFQKQPAANLRHFFRVTEEDLSNPLFSHLPRWELTAKLKLLFSPDFQAAIGKYDALAQLAESLPPEFRSWPHFSQAEFLEARYFLPGYLLSSQGDRVAMAHSVEGRYPFLDYRVIEFAAKLPVRSKMRVLNQKYILKRACEGLIPESILQRPKQPYRAPDGKCFFDQDAPDYAKELLSPEQIKKAGIFDSRAVNMLASRFSGGKPGSLRDNMGIVAVLSTQLLASQFLNA
ncbi:MAG TPA: asparagine synthase (glutamine-hydrolyzing) [Candidatus Sulfotelmatobacter sp.]|nr:asparagine synthase (glutamine-hydrolyzing) [Candidatus Sulfotelmatobacter sp.]